MGELWPGPFRPTVWEDVEATLTLPHCGLLSCRVSRHGAVGEYCLLRVEPVSGRQHSALLLSGRWVHRSLWRVGAGRARVRRTFASRVAVSLLKGDSACRNGDTASVALRGAGVGALSMAAAVRFGWAGDRR